MKIAVTPFNVSSIPQTTSSIFWRTIVSVSQGSIPVQSKGGPTYLTLSDPTSVVDSLELSQESHPHGFWGKYGHIIKLVYTLYNNKGKQVEHLDEVVHHQLHDLLQ